MTRQHLIDRSEAHIRQILKEDDYFLLLDAIEDRNRLSHIYDAETFNQILERLPDYASHFEWISAQLGKQSK